MSRDNTSGRGANPATVSTIRLNTIGFLPDHDKRASIAVPCARFVVRAEDGKEAYAGRTAGPLPNADTGEDLFLADFSALKKPGVYYLDVPGVGRSASFRISRDVYDGAFYTVTRGMYLWRCGMAVSGRHGGQTFAHAACHRDDGYLDFVGGGHVRRDGAGGWHDAGDYNKYVVNAGVTVGVMFQAWERFRDRLKGFRLDLPESGNGTPDYLNELRWEMAWLLKMQAPDGSVYHKLSTQNFGGFILPERETAERYFTPWSSAATADFVAMAAMAARGFGPYDDAFARRCLDAAGKSYRFLTDHPEEHRADLTGFRTGGYGTTDPDDRLWAAAEMWETTGDGACLTDFETRVRALGAKVEADWDWGNVANLGIATYLLSKRPGRDAGLVRDLRAALVGTADDVVRTREAHGYGRPLGTRYYWGCNGTVARQTVLLHTANAIAPKRVYVETSLDALGHLFGRNPYGRSFVTGVGAGPPLHPHDRRSGGDNVEAPWPGYLVGGAWPRAIDWKDEQGSYQTNEIAINWNSALVYALAPFVSGSGGAPRT
jgi:endoglucanase